MTIQQKKSFALVNYEICNQIKYNHGEGICVAVSVCVHKVLKQIDGVFESPIVFQNMCMGCWDCVEACRLDAIQIKDIPYVSLIAITAMTLLFANTSDLTIISSFAGSTFLLIFAAINLLAIRLRTRIGLNAVIPLSGLLLTLASWVVLSVYLYRTTLKGLAWIGAIYLCVIAAELLFSERKLFLKPRA